MQIQYIIKKIILLSLLILLTSCISRPPRDVNNLCNIFKQYPIWYQDALDVQRRWRVPVAVQMAIMHQESKFNAQALPPRGRILWIFPGRRPSTAYGYAQALDGTWALYKRSQLRLFASRERFSDGVDFIGWYANQAYQRARISRSDPYSLYLAYHEGVGGYLQKPYLRKPWLLVVAHKVSARAKLYQAQLNSCKRESQQRSWYKVGQ